jgi:hypothetical protein
VTRRSAGTCIKFLSLVFGKFEIPKLVGQCPSLSACQRSEDGENKTSYQGTGMSLFPLGDFAIEYIGGSVIVNSIVGADVKDVGKESMIWTKVAAASGTIDFSYYLPERFRPTEGKSTTDLIPILDKSFLSPIPESKRS